MPSHATPMRRYINPLRRQKICLDQRTEYNGLPSGLPGAEIGGDTPRYRPEVSRDNPPAASLTGDILPRLDESSISARLDESSISGRSIVVPSNS